MKLTPLDIHHKEFRRSLRGYEEKEVDDFLDDVADDFERLFKENIELSEKLDGATEQLRRYQVNEQTIQNTMVAAQRSAEDIVSKANADADQVLRDAELKAKEIIHNALQQKQKVAGELTRIKAAEEDFRLRFKAILDSAATQVNEVTLPEDVNTLLADDTSDPAPTTFVAAPAASAPAGGVAATEMPTYAPRHASVGAVGAERRRRARNRPSTCSDRGRACAVDAGAGARAAVRCRCGVGEPLGRCGVGAAGRGRQPGHRSGCRSRGAVGVSPPHARRAGRA